jgi:hypothetical protein
MLQAAVATVPLPVHCPGVTVLHPALAPEQNHDPLVPAPDPLVGSEMITAIVSSTGCPVVRTVLVNCSNTTGVATE